MLLVCSAAPYSQHTQVVYTSVCLRNATEEGSQAHQHVS